MMDFNIEHINLHRNRNYVFIKWSLRNFGHSCPFTSKNMFRFFFSFYFGVSLCSKDKNAPLLLSLLLLLLLVVRLKFQRSFIPFGTAARCVQHYIFKLGVV